MLVSYCDYSEAEIGVAGPWDSVAGLVFSGACA